MILLGAIEMLLGALLLGGQQALDATNQLFGNFVAVTGDAHQAKVAQDIFRQEIRYERSLQIREDIRDVNKMMLESVQTHLFMGSIILGVCFTMFVEGYPPDDTDRTIQDVWLVFTGWSATFTLLSLWLALCFQSKVSSCARERLLRKHRFQMPDELMVGRMGGNNLVNQMSIVHEKVLTKTAQVFNGVAKPAAAGAGAVAIPDDVYTPVKRRTRRVLRTVVEDIDGCRLDAEPVRKGIHAWMHRLSQGYDKHTILDLPAFLVGETLVRSRWYCHGDTPLLLRVHGEATLYVAAQAPPREDKHGQEGVQSAMGLDGRQQMPSWPEEELPTVTAGYHRDWRGPSGVGEFQRVDGFSIFVDVANIEVPLYKIVLEPPDETSGKAYTDLAVHWNFKRGCEALLVVIRKGQVHCKEEDWPIVEFNDEIRQIMPLRDYSGKFIRYGVSCLTCAAFFTYLARIWLIRERILWWFESVLLILALTPAFLAIAFVPIYVTGAAMTEQISMNAPDLVKFFSSTVSENSFDASNDGSPNPEPDIEGALPATPRSSPDLADTIRQRIAAPEDGYGTNDAGSVNGAGCGLAEDPLCLPEAGSPTAPAVQRERLVGEARAPLATSSMGGAPTAGALGAGLVALCSEGPTRAAPERLGRALVGATASVAEPLEACGGAGLQMARCQEVVQTRLERRPGPQGDDATAIGEPRPEVPMATLTASRSVGLALPADAAGNSFNAGDRNHHDDRGSFETREEDLKGGVARFLRQAYKRIPSVLKPIEDGNTLMGDNSNTAKSLRSTLRKFEKWTGFLRFLFIASLISAFASPHLWFEDLESSLVPGAGGTGEAASDKSSLVWTRWHVLWPPFFQPTAAALEEANLATGATSEVLWIAAGSVLRSLQPSGDSASSTTFQATGAPLLLQGAARGLALLPRGLAETSAGPRRRLVVVGEAGLYRVRLPEPEASVIPQGLDATEFADAGPLIGLPAGLPELKAAAALEVSGFGGPDAAALSAWHLGSSGPLGGAAGIYLCGGSGTPVVAANSTHSTQRLWLLAHLEAGGWPAALQRASALHASPAGLNACGAAEEPVLWLAAADGTIAALGLDSGSLLAIFAPQAGGIGDSGTVVALTGNTSHLVAIVSIEDEHSAVFSTPCPVLPKGGGSFEL